MWFLLRTAVFNLYTFRYRQKHIDEEKFAEVVELTVREVGKKEQSLRSRKSWESTERTFHGESAVL